MAEDQGQDEKAKSGGGKKLLIIGLVAGLVLGGGGAAGYFLFAGGDEPAPEEAVPAEVEEEVEAPTETSFIKLDQLSAPLVSDGRVLGYVLLNLSIEVEGSDNELLVAQRLPALKAAFLRDVTETPIGKPDQPMMIDYDSLTKRLKSVANRELGANVVHRVLVTQSTRL